MEITEERPGDAQAIHEVTHRAFAGQAYAAGNEARIPDALRAARALTLSLVALERNYVIGHAAFSPVTIANAGGWFGLGPVSVIPQWQRRGIGSALIVEGLERLHEAGAGGVVVLGDPEYYRRFGFAVNPSLTYQRQPSEYLQSLVLRGSPPSGDVVFHPGFATA